MTEDHTVYQNPLSSRYASKEMSHLFSSEVRYLTWRKIWIALAKAQKNAGYAIKDEQIRAMETAYSNLDIERAHELEKKTHHDVMAHIHAFAEVCPSAKGILHLGATSCVVTDNGDLILFREALKMIGMKLATLITHLVSFAERHASLPTLGFTHFQPAQPTTVGKRACLWLQDFASDLEQLQSLQQDFPCLGAKGATGTQASFLELFGGDAQKVQTFEQNFVQELMFKKSFPITGQTYPRKVDDKILHILASIAVSATKCATDLRLLANLGEIEESFAETQVGSTAMPYKRNPIHAERICGLSRFLISLQSNTSHTAAGQWLERTLDDSSNRRITMPEAFLTADAVLLLLIDLIPRLAVLEKKITSNLLRELPLLITENLLMQAVKKGKDRQAVHEGLRIFARQYSEKINSGDPFDIYAAIAADPEIGLTPSEIEASKEPRHLIGLAPEQVSQYIEKDIKFLLEKYRKAQTEIPSLKI